LLVRLGFLSMSLVVVNVLICQWYLIACLFFTQLPPESTVILPLVKISLK